MSRLALATPSRFLIKFLASSLEIWSFTLTFFFFLKNYSFGFVRILRKCMKVVLVLVLTLFFLVVVDLFALNFY